MFNVTLNDIPLVFETRPSLFSPNAPDRGTLALLRAADAYLSAQGDTSQPIRMCDLGCGYGLVGIYLAKRYPAAEVFLCDADSVAVDCARQNAAANGIDPVHIGESDAFSSMNETGFTLILSNPPYHTDFNVAKRFIEKGFNRLAVGGVMGMVTKRREWYKQKFIAVFGGVRVTEDDGYFIFMAEKRGASYGKPGKSRK